MTDHQLIATPMQPLREGTVQVQAEYTAFDPRTGTPGSLVGRITQVGPAVTTLASGDLVLAFGLPEASPVLAVEACLKLPDADIDLAEAALWPLTAWLIAALRQARLELGERVLVLGHTLQGQLLGQLTLIAGAVSCHGFDPSGTPTTNGTSPAWANDESALPDSKVDLLIDACGDPALLVAHLNRVADTGRVLLAGGFQQPVDFDFYPDLHRRSLNVISCPLPASLGNLGQELGPAEAEHLLDFGRYLLASQRLAPALMHLRATETERLAETIETATAGVLIEW